METTRTPTPVPTPSRIHKQGVALLRTDTRLICVKRLAALMDCHRTSVRRWLDEAGIQPVALGTGRRGAIRYRCSDIEAWLKSLPEVK